VAGQATFEILKLQQMRDANSVEEKPSQPLPRLKFMKVENQDRK